MSIRRSPHEIPDSPGLPRRPLRALSACPAALRGPGARPRRWPPRPAPEDLGRVDLLILDDWGLTVLAPSQRIDLLEVLEDRHGRGATLVTSQIPIEQWHDVIGDPSLADVILDRLVHNAHRLTLAGESLRRLSAHRELDAEARA